MDMTLHRETPEAEMRKETSDLIIDSRDSKQWASSGLFMYGGLLAFKMLRVLINGSKIQYGEHPLL